MNNLDRVHALAEKLKAIRNIHLRSSEQGRDSESSISWAAERFIAKCIEKAQFETPLPDRAKAVEILTQQFLSSAQENPDHESAHEKASACLGALEKEGIIRFVLGEYQFAEVVRNALIFKDEMAELSENQAVIKALSSYHRYSDDYPSLVLGQEELNTIYLRHKTCFPATPELSELSEGNPSLLTKLSVDGALFYRLNFKRQGSPDYLDENLCAKIAALVWMDIEKESTAEGAKALDWYRKVRSLSGWDRAPLFLPEEAQERLLDGILLLLLDEPSLKGGWDAEIERVGCEIAFPEHRNRISQLKNAPSPDAGLVDCWKWWGSVSRYSRGDDIGIHDGSRSQVGRLLFVLLRFDGEEVPHRAEPFKRLFKILGDHHEHPYLAYWLIYYFSFSNRPEFIAWMLRNVGTASMGLLLLDRIEFFFHQFGGGWNENREGREKFRSLLWEEAVGIFAQTVGVVGQVPPLQDRAQAIVDIVQSLFSRRLEFEGRQNSQPNAGEGVYLASRAKYLLDTLSDASIIRHDYPAPIKSTHFLSALAPELHDIISRNIAALKAAKPDAVPYTGLMTILWLLESIDRVDKTTRDQSQSYLRHSKESRRIEPLDVAETIVRLYTDELKAEHVETDMEGKPRLGVVLEYSELIEESPWIRLAIVLERAERLNEFLLFDFSDSICHIQSNVKKDDDGYEELRAISNRSYKIRLHLRILLTLFESLTSKRTDIEFDPRPLREKVEAAIERVLTTYIILDLPYGRVDIFDPQVDRPVFSKHLNLFGRSVRALKQFAEKRQENIITRFSTQMRNFRLLSLLRRELVAERLIAIVDSNLDSFPLDKYLEDQHLLPEIEGALIEAINSGQIDKARKILEYGDKVTERHAYRADWEMTAYRIRLHMILAEEDELAGKLKKINDLPLPEKYQRQSKVNGHIDEYHDLEARREHIIGLTYLETDPEEAYRRFNKLLKRYPKSRANAVNRFAAHIRMADQEKEEAAKKKAIKDALVEWQQAEKQLENGKLDSAENYNLLFCYFELDRPEDFEATWNSLDSSIKMDRHFLELTAQHFKTTHNDLAFREMLLTAKRYHGISDANIPDWYAKLAALLETSGTASNPQVSRTINRVESFDPDVLRRALNEIRLLSLQSPENFAQVVADNTSIGSDPIATFLLERVCYACHGLVERIASISKLDGKENASNMAEPVYNHLLGEFLRQQSFVLKQPEVTCGSECGYSEEGKGAGELDIQVRWGGSMIGTTIEALRIGGTRTDLASQDKDHIVRHATKLHQNYDRTNACLFLVNYVQGSNFADVVGWYENYIRSEEYGKRHKDKGLQFKIENYDIRPDNRSIKCFKEIIQESGLEESPILSPCTVFHLLVNLSNPRSMN